MNGPRSIDHGFFPQEINMWWDISEDLMDHWRALVQIPRLPELNERLSPRLTQLVPALNQARLDICYNISLAKNATRLFAKALTESAQNYGMSEDEAVALSRDI